MHTSRTGPDHHRRRWVLGVVAVTLLLAAGLSRRGASAVEVADLSVQAPVLVFLDGDHAVYEAKGEDTGGGSVAHAGFTTYDDATALPAYEIRLVASDGIESFRPLVQRAADAATAAGGPVLHVAAGQVQPGTSPGQGQIFVEVASSSPCGDPWLGCGGPTIDDHRIISGRLWLNPRLASHPVGERDNTVRHEVGHTVGLGHYSGSYDGRLQTMHPTSFDATRYEAGDQAGLQFVSGNTGPRPAAPAPAPSPTSAPSVDPVGAIETVEPGTFGILVRGWAVDPDSGGPAVVVVTVDGQPTEVSADKEHPLQDGHGFALVWLDGPGTHEVCVEVRNGGAGNDLALGCRSVGLSTESIGLIGLQTV